MTNSTNAEALTKKLVDDGKLIEMGFNTLRNLMIPMDAPEGQVSDLRLAYMAGAQHLWASVMLMLDPGVEETPEDIKRMDSIQAEFDVWEKELRLRFSQGVGGEQ